jgi:hypothetical protein
MKTKLLLIAFLSINFFSYSQTTYVPDDNFENYLETHNASGTVVSVGDPSSMGNGIALDDYVTTASINNVINLDVNNQNISNLTGIEDFSSLVQLVCRNNSLTTLNINQNTSLKDLYCQFNQISSINTTPNTQLEKLYIYNNSLIDLDLSQNNQLTHLVANTNQLTNLVVTQNTNLVTLEFHSNQISSIDLTQNTLIISLKTGNNFLTSLDLSNNVNLQIAQIENNQISKLNLTPINSLVTLICNNNFLSSLDFSLFPSFQYLNCNSNLLTRLNVKNGNNSNFNLFNSTNNPNLTCIKVDNAGWSTTNWTNVDGASTFVNNSTECSSLSIQDLAQEKINLFPNPVETTFSLSLNEKSNYILVNINGQIIKEGELKVGENEIDISKFQSGIYILKVYGIEKTFTNKVYKK